MSRIRLSVSYVSITAILAGAAWTALVSFPLTGEPQVTQAQAGVSDGPGVTVDTGGVILHRTGASYPSEARNNLVEGKVVLDLQLNQAGEVEDAHAVSGPEDLRAAALQSALQWDYVPDGSTSRTVRAAITYQILPRPDALNSARDAQIVHILNSPKVFGTLVKINMSELPPALQSTLQAQLQPFQGQGISNHVMNQIRAIVFAADSHVSTTWAVTPGTQNHTLTLGMLPDMHLPADANLAYQFAAGSVPRILVSPRVQELSMLATKVAPANPTGATGAVSIWVVIGTDGHVTQVHLQDGPTELQQAAIDAVQQYTYKPTIMNEEPCEVETLVRVTFGQ